MKTLSLYPLIQLCVLIFIGCSPTQEETTAPSRTAPPLEVPEAAPLTDTTPTILFLGNSLSAGLGVDLEQAFPALVQEKIDSLGWKYRVVNAGLSGETTAGGLRRIDWLLKQPVEVLVLELGGNDGLRGIPPEVTRTNLAEIIEKTRTANPHAEIVLAGMQVPPNLGQDYTGKFRDLFPALAHEKDTALIPFLLEGVGGIPNLNQPDGIHPTARGHEIVAETVWTTLKPLLEALNARRDAAARSLP